MFKLFSCAAMLLLLGACDGAAKLDNSSATTVDAASNTSIEAATVSATDPAVAPIVAEKVTPKTVEKLVSAPAVEEKYIAGKDYRVLARPIPTADPNKVEVTKFFWYGCSHCYAFEPQITRFKDNAPDFVNVVPMPTMWRDNMTVHAKAYFAMKNLKKPELHEALFKALNVDRNPLSNDAAIATLFAEHGVDKEKTMKMLSSFGVSAQVQKAQSLAKGAKISGTPTLVVNGKYVVETSLAGSQANMLKIADYLARKENAN